MTKQREAIKKEILAFTKAQWVYGELDNMTDHAQKMLETGEAKNIQMAAYKAIDNYY